MPEKMHLSARTVRGLHCKLRLVEPAGRWCGRIAQLVEQLTLNQRAQGSSPCAPTNDISLYSLLNLASRCGVPNTASWQDRLRARAAFCRTHLNDQIWPEAERHLSGDDRAG